MAGTTEWLVGWDRVPDAEAWGTGTVPTLAAGDGLLIESENMPEMIPEMIPDANVGDALTQRYYQGNRVGDGTLVVPVRFETLEKVLALFMGDDNCGLAPGETSGTAYEHEMIFQPSNTTKKGCLAFKKLTGSGAGIWEYPFCKVSQVEITHNNGKLMGTFTLIPNTIKRDTDATNDDASLAAATPTTRKLQVLFTHLLVMAKEVTGSEGNLSPSTDEIKVTQIAFSANRNIAGIPESGSEGEIGEPETDGLPEATLTMTVADYVASGDAFIKAAQQRQDDDTPKIYKATLIWEGQEIAGSDASPDKNRYTFELDLPQIQLGQAPVQASAPGARVGVEMQFNVGTPDATLDGSDWTWTAEGTNSFRAYMINENSAAAA